MSDYKPLRILIVDDHDLLRMGLVVFLEMQEQMVVVGEARTGLEAVQLATQLHPDVILMDAQMPMLDGITATRRIKQTDPRIYVFILTNDVGDEQRQAALDAGADAYFHKSGSVEPLAQAIQAIRQPIH
jgi:two-component system, NarL family, response regulator LiaR